MATNGEGGSESEVAGLKIKVATLRHKLKECKGEIHKLQKKLKKTEQLQKNTDKYNDDLRKQVDKLSAEIHERKKREKNRTDAETQTEDYSWTESDYYNYYYGGYYQSETSTTEAQDNSASVIPETQGTAEPCPPGTEGVAGVSDSVENSSAAAVNPEESEGTSIADLIRATAEEAVSQTGFVFDENSGMYYDHSTSLYYDSASQLYYDANSGMYYYYDADSGRYHFHSRVQVQAYEATADPSQDKKGKKKRKESDKSSLQDGKDLEAGICNDENDGRRSQQRRKGSPLRRVRRRSHSPRKRSHSPSRRSRSPRKRSRSPRRRSKSLGSPEHGVERVRCKRKKIKRVSCSRRGARSDEASDESEPEEGEITESEGEQSSSSESSSSSSSSVACSISEPEDPGGSEEVWPPCVRVTVVRSPVLQTGTLFIITADAPATIGREKDMDHAIRIPEVGVSKFHAEVYFDQDLQCYVLVDQGSQNGTVINGTRILQPKAKSEPCTLAHGDEIKMGDTVLSFHIHSGNDTCDGCEPGQVIAHLNRHKREEPEVIIKEDKEVQRQKELKQMKVKYGLKNSEYEGAKALKNSRYKDRAEKRRQAVGSEGTFHRDDAPASVHVEISDENKGRKILEKMGWKKGEGLGKDGTGRKDPIQLRIRKSHAGLGTAAAVSVDDAVLTKSRTQENWEKARERFADMCQSSETSSHKESQVLTSWVKSKEDE